MSHVTASYDSSSTKPVDLTKLVNNRRLLCSYAMLPSRDLVGGGRHEGDAVMLPTCCHSGRRGGGYQDGAHTNMVSEDACPPGGIPAAAQERQPSWRGEARLGEDPAMELNDLCRGDLSSRSCWVSGLRRLPTRRRECYLTNALPAADQISPWPRMQTSWGLGPASAALAGSGRLWQAHASCRLCLSSSVGWSSFAVFAPSPQPRGSFKALWLVPCRRQCCAQDSDLAML